LPSASIPTTRARATATPSTDQLAGHFVSTSHNQLASGMSLWTRLLALIDERLDRLSHWMIHHPRLLAGLLAMITLTAMALVPFMKFSEGLESFYDRSHPRQRVLEAVEKEFVYGRWLFITYADDDVFSHDSLSTIRQLSIDLATLHVPDEDDGDAEPVADVLSLTQVKDIVASNDSFRNIALVPAEIPTDTVALDAVAARAQANHLIRDNLVGKDRQHAGMVVRLKAGLHETTVAHLVDEVRNRISKVSKASGIEFHLTGIPAAERDTPYITKVDTVKFTPIILLIAGIFIFISVRKLLGVVLVLSIISVASVVALACFPLTGSSYNPLCSILLSLVTIECVSFSLHYLIESSKATQAMPTTDTRVMVFRSLMKPAFMCWLTTAIGFGSLVFTKTQAIREFGLVMATALAAGGIVIPMAFAIAWGLKPPEAFVSLEGEVVNERFSRWMTRYLQFLERRGVWVLLVAAVVSAVFFVGALRIRVGESDIGYFRPSHGVHAGALAMQEQLGGSNPIVISIKKTPLAGADDEGATMIEPAELAKLDALALFLRQEAGVDRVTSVSDYVKIMNNAFMGLPNGDLKLPPSRAAVSQLLLINTDDRIREYINTSHDWVRMVARTPEHDTVVLKPVFSRVEAYLAHHFPASEGYDAKVTGESYIFALNTDYNSQTQAIGLMSSALSTLIMLILLFRSLRVGVYAIPANAFPILATLGLMGWLGIELSVGTSMISSITIGFVVDDTIHFISHYRERIEAHGNVRLAVEEAYQVKGPGTIFTGIIFTLGFSVFMLSDLVPLQHFGLLAALAMFIGGIGELTIGPALLLMTRSPLGARPLHVSDQAQPAARHSPLHNQAPAVHTREPTLVDVVRRRAEHEPKRKAFTFIANGDQDESTWDYEHLDQRTRAIAAVLAAHNLRGERAILLYPPGLDYIATINACMFANVLAVPAYPPDPARLQKTLPRLRTIARDSGAKAILTTDVVMQMREMVVDMAAEFGELQWIATDVIDTHHATDWRDPNRSADDVAFLQYTSGSTADPRGVQLTHRNLNHNMTCIRTQTRLTPDSVGVSWLPPYHDMGLIGFILVPVFAGAHVVHMSPLHFLERPMRWLEAVSRHRAWISAAPNFAYDLAARRVTAAEKSSLDLRTWKMALNGAEPVRATTLQRFSDAFGPCGFERSSLRPVYGLAEASLLVSFPRVDRPTQIERVSPAALREGIVKSVSEFDQASVFVGCGLPVGGQIARIVDPLTSKPVGDDTVGEIWISGVSVAHGYFGKPDESQRSFHNHIDGDARRYLRTGDLGFIRNEGLFVTGRLKDLIVVRGQNHYPQDIELTVEGCHAAMRPGCVAAFAIEHDDDARLVVVAELDNRRMQGIDPAVIIDAVRTAVAQHHELHVQTVALIRMGALPKTSSGKVQRRATRVALLEGSLEEILRSDSATHKNNNTDALVLTKDLLMSLAPAAREAQLAAHVQRSVAQALGVPLDEVTLERPLYALGLDSMAAVQLRAELEQLTGSALPLADYLEGPSITQLARLALGTREAASTAVALGGGVAPGPTGDVLLGSLAEFQANPVDYLFSLRRRYGEVVRIRLGPWVTHLISQPEHIKAVLRDDAANFVKAENYANLERLVGRGMLTAEGAEWQQLRKAAQPGFTPDAMAKMAQVAMPAAVERSMQRMLAAGDEPIDIEHEMLRLALDAIGTGTLGLSLTGRLDDVLHAIEDASAFGYDDMSAYLNLPGSDNRAASDARFHDAMKTIDAIIYESVDAALAGRAATPLLQSLADASVGAHADSDGRRSMRDQIMTLLLAGHDTTAEAFTWTLYLLATHPDVDQRVQAQLHHDDPGQRHTWLNAVIKESMRLYPPGWLFTRRVVAERSFGEYNIPAGSLVLISPWVTHRDPFLWDNADQFRPQRFLQNDVPDAAYLPFGLGQRACIGAALAMTELRVGLAALLSRFQFVCVNDEKPLLASRVTLRPRGPIHVRAKARS
jgi:acyl-CoA synthetase (AMP-forming)/AMP-acid ligase II/cytochrome P450/predicted RND superfamily exporter protein/acyl carrier protein